MSTAKNAQCSQIARNVERGKYVKQYKFADFGSVAEDTIQGQQRVADERLKQIQAQRKIRVGARWTTGRIATQHY
jgi:hypothetical protein